MPSVLGAVAGDPITVAAAARSMEAIAGDVARQAAALRSLANSSSCWSGKAAAAAQTRSATLPPKLDKVTTSYGGAGQALLDYARALADAQQRSRSAIGAAQRAEADLEAARQAQAAAVRADAAAAAAARATCQVAPPPTAPRYQGVIDDASSRFARAVAANDDAHAAQKAAATRAATALKAASRQGIHNQSWWHHVTRSVEHWTSAHWRATLAHVAAVAGKLSILASAVAVALAVGGMFFPPLEAIAAAAESEAVAFGALAGVAATTVELSDKQARDKGMVNLALLAMPPAAKGLQRLIPIGAISASRVSVIDDPTPIPDGADAADGATTPRAIPLGFADDENFRRFANEMEIGVERSGYSDSILYMRGSSVTGVSHKYKVPFDGGTEPSDLDTAVAGSTVFAKAKELGLQLRGGKSRTGPLSDAELEAFGLLDLQTQLCRLTNRDVTIMVYADEAAILARGPAIKMTP